jgi:hypothetical protein
LVVYYALACVLLLLGLFAQNCRPKYLQTSDQLIETGCSRFGMIETFIVIVLVAFAGMRYQVGTDYQTYFNIYNLSTPLTFHELLSSLDLEFGYTCLNYITKQVTDNPYAIFWSVAVVTYVPIVASIRKTSSIFALSILLFLLLGYYTSSLNGMRQWVAVAFLFYGSSHLLMGKTFKFVLFGIIASLFHTTAIIALLIQLVLKRLKPSLWILLVSLSLAIIALITFPHLPNLLAFVSGIEGRYMAYLYSEETGLGIRVKFLTWFLVACASLFGLRCGRLANNECTRFSLCSIIVSVAFIMIGFNNPTLARLGTYFEIYAIYLIPEIVMSLQPRSRMLFTWVVMLLCAIWFGFDLAFYHGVLPYRTNIHQVW